MQCPTCGTNDINQTGSTCHGKQNDKGRDCGRPLVEPPQWQPVAQATQALLERLRLENMPVADLVRRVQLSERWLQQDVNRYYQSVPPQVAVEAKTRRRLTLQLDEWWSVVAPKGKQQGVWFALAVETRAIGGGSIGARAAASAQALWESLPAGSRQCAVCDTAGWLLPPCCLSSVIKPLAKTVAEPVTLNGSTTRDANGSPA